MAESDITNNLSTQGQYTPVTSTSIITGSNSSGSSKSSISESSIKQSELEAMISYLAAGLPLLQPPNFVLTDVSEIGKNSVSGVSGASGASALLAIASQVEKTKNDIINSMWDSFLKGVHDLEKRAKEDDVRHWTEEVNKGGPKSSSEYYAYLMVSSAARRADETNPTNGSALAVQFNSTYNQWIVQPANGGESLGISPSGPRGYPDPAFIAGSVMAGSDVVRQAIGSVSPTLGTQMSVSPIADAITAVGPTSGLPTDIQAASAMVAALLNNGAMYKSAAETIQQTANDPKATQDLSLPFAQNYASNVMAIVTKNIESGQPTNENRLAQNNMVRLLLSVMALNMLYRAGYGGMSQKEFTDLLKPNEVNTLDPAIQGQVTQLVGLIKSFMPTDPIARDNTMNRLNAYIGKNASVDSMLAATKLFSGLLDTGDINHERRNAATG